jgi:hypothetical protein
MKVVFGLRENQPGAEKRSAPFDLGGWCGLSYGPAQAAIPNEDQIGSQGQGKTDVQRIPDVRGVVAE